MIQRLNEQPTIDAVEVVRTGNFKQPKDKPLRNKSANNATSNSFTVLDDDSMSDLPF